VPCADDGLLAELTASSPDNTIPLGRRNDGVRSWEIPFTWAGECSLDPGAVSAELRVLQSAHASLAGITPQIDVRNRDQRIIVTLDLDRATIDPGRWTGVLEVSGAGIAGVATATVTIQQQEPISQRDMDGFEQIVWVGVGAAIFSVLLLLSTRWNKVHRDLAIAPLVVIGVVTLYPVLAHARDDQVPALWWPIWLGAFGVVGGFLIGALKHRSGGLDLQGGVKFGAALVLSFGAGIAAWRSQYVNTPDWALNLESALSLVGVVGAATVTAALLFLAPATDRPTAPTAPAPTAPQTPPAIAPPATPSTPD
jgi:hypothetical protein